jgi:hypothetical protein
MRPIKQPANYVIAVGLAVAVIIGIWQMRLGDMLGMAGNSVANIADQAPTDPLHSAQASGANDETAEPDGQSGTGATRGPSDETIEAANGFYRPIPIPGEFAASGEREGHLSEFHAMLEHEREDPEWALPLERELEDFLNEMLDPSLVTVKLIECRSDSCEILAVGYGEQAKKEWLNLAQALYESGLMEKWFKTDGQGQGNGSCGAVDLAPGVAGLVCQFSRVASHPIDEDAATTGTFSLTAPYPDGVEFTPTPVPDEFVRLYETNAEVYDFHRALQVEAVDHSWAPFIENQIIEHFSAIPELESVIYHHIECRMTRCEVQLTIHDPQAAVPWTLELGNFNDQPWNDLEFKIYNVPTDDDLMRIVWLLNRNTGN